MLISEFARQTGLSKDTIRFYVRKGLLEPENGRKGGSNPYQMFTPAHVEAAQMIRLAQSLGFSLKEIAAFNSEYQAGAFSDTRALEIIRLQVRKLEEKADQLRAMIGYMQAKLSWIENDRRNPKPLIVSFVKTDPANI